MLNKAACVALALMLVSVWGCASNRETLAEKDRVINEQRQENLALRSQIQDGEATRKLVARQYDQKKGEMERLSQDYSVIESERDRLSTELEETRNSGARPAAPEFTVDDPNVEVVVRPNGEVVLRVSNEVTFSSGSASLTRGGQATLRKVASILKRHREYSISIEGHTDDTPLKATKNRWKSNMNLSLARALSVRNFLSKASAIGHSRMRVVGYGETRPLIAAKTKKARSKNRRVEIVLFKGDD